jgi:hypothetical protein
MVGMVAVPRLLVGVSLLLLTGCLQRWQSQKQLSHPVLTALPVLLLLLPVCRAVLRVHCWLGPVPTYPAAAAAAAVSAASPC